MNFRRLIFFGAASGFGFAIGLGIALSMGVSDGQRAVPERSANLGNVEVAATQKRPKNASHIPRDAKRPDADRESRRDPLRKKSRDGFRFDGYLYFNVSCYTKHDDPGFGKRYASINFLRGGTKYNPKLPRYPLVSTYVDDGHYTAAIPKSMKHIHEDLASDGYHKWFLHIPGYNDDDWDKGYLTTPRDRITKYDRLDLLYTGWNAQRRAKKFGVKQVRVELWERIVK